jgi:hypothetical protein
MQAESSPAVAFLHQLDPGFQGHITCDKLPTPYFDPSAPNLLRTLHFPHIGPRAHKESEPRGPTKIKSNSFKSLNGRRSSLPGKRLRRFDRWGRTYLGARRLSDSLY